MDEEFDELLLLLAVVEAGSDEGPDDAFDPLEGVEEAFE
jgi:hypothetical protein